MKRVVILLVVLAGGIAAAAFTVPSNAATVNSQAISQSSLNADLAAISASPQYQCYLDAQIVVQTGGRASLPPIDGVGTGTYNSTFVSYWLTRMINATLVRQLAERHGASVTASDRAAARTEVLQSIQGTLSQVSGSQYECQVSPTSVLASLPASFVNRQVEDQAYTDALLSHGSASLGEVALRRYFAAHASEFDTICVSGILVSSQAKATQLRSQIESGTPFAQVAGANSLDTATAAKGGALGCFGATSSSYAAVRQDVGSLAVGQVTQPLASSGGNYVLLQVTSRRPATFSKVRSAVRQAVLSSGQVRARAVLTTAAKRASVAVNPTYGQWNPAAVSRGVLPPKSPPASEVLSPAANQPSFSTAQGTGGSPG